MAILHTFAVTGPTSGARLRAGRRGAGRLEVGPAWALAAPPDRDRHGAVQPRRRVPLADRGHRHHHARRAAHLPYLRGAGPVRARPDPRTHARRPRRCHGAGAQERPQARHHGRQAETRARDGRHGPDRARDRNTTESREDSALRGAQGRTRLTACPPLAVRSSEVAARDTTVGSGPALTTGAILFAVVFSTILNGRTPLVGI